MSTFDEDTWTAWLQAHAPAPPEGLGIGDDAAVLASDPRRLVATSDVLVDGAHAIVADAGLAAFAYKAIAVNLSDLAAMGAEPLGVLVGVVAPRETVRSDWEALGAGLIAACRAFDLPLLGGDTNTAAAPWTLAITALGRAQATGVVKRVGAQVGDVLSVSGPLGGSLAADRHLRPAPRLALGAWLAREGLAHAMMDLSDGLGRDLPRLLHASSVGARIEASALPIHEDVPPAPHDRVVAALGDGEDFELLVAHAALDHAAAQALEARGFALHPIGEVVAATDGLRLHRQEADGTVRSEPWPGGGFDHLAG